MIGVRNWCAVLAMNCCCDCTAVRSIVNKRFSVTTTGAISRGTEDSSIGRKSSGERSAISFRSLLTGRSPSCMPTHTSTSVTSSCTKSQSSVLMKPKRAAGSTVERASATVMKMTPARVSNRVVSVRRLR